jgi:hypothetical protein
MFGDDAQTGDHVLGREGRDVAGRSAAGTGSLWTLRRPR